MSAPKAMTGGRALLMIGDRVVGTFANFNYSVTADVQPIFILGRTGAAELVYTSLEPVSCSASGFRIVDAGAYATAKMPALQDMLTADYIEIAVIDRQTNKRIGRINSVRPQSYSVSFPAKGTADMSVSFIGILADDESTTNSERSDAADLP